MLRSQSASLNIRTSCPIRDCTSSAQRVAQECGFRPEKARRRKFGPRQVLVKSRSFVVGRGGPGHARDGSHFTLAMVISVSDRVPR